MSYTKGEWRTVVREDGSVYQEKGDPLVGAHCAYDISDDPERGYFKADHDLENAAPDMYEALKRIEPIVDALEFLSHDKAADGSIAKQVRAAINKADGHLDAIEREAKGV